jgi:hypothetical protein
VAAPRVPRRASWHGRSHQGQPTQADAAQQDELR